MTKDYPGAFAALRAILAKHRKGMSVLADTETNQFQRPEPEVFEDLAELTRVGHEQWRRAGFLDRGPIPPERFTAAFRVAGGDPKTLAAKRRKALAARRDGTRRRET